MVRSIEHIPCIDDLLEELNLSPETRKSVEKFVFFSPVSLVCCGRKFARFLEENPNYDFESYDPWYRANRVGDWAAELAEAVDRAGFVRHDIDALGYAMIGFREILGDLDEFWNNKIHRRKDIWYYGKCYEKFKGMSDEQYADIMNNLEKCLDDKDMENAVKLAFGLEDGKVPQDDSDQSISKYFHRFEWDRFWANLYWGLGHIRSVIPRKNCDLKRSLNQLFNNDYAF